MRAIHPLLPLAAALILAGSARAGTLSLPLGQAERLHIAGAAANVVVGEPRIADVTVVDSHTLYVVGRGYGSTAVDVTDALGRTLYAGEVTVERSGSSVAVYHGVTRADYACAATCSEAASAGPAEAGK